MKTNYIVPQIEELKLELETATTTDPSISIIPIYEGEGDSYEKLDQQ